MVLPLPREFLASLQRPQPPLPQQPPTGPAGFLGPTNPAIPNPAVPNPSPPPTPSGLGPLPGMPGPGMSPADLGPQLQDPVLARLLQQPPPTPPEPVVPDRQKPGYRPMPSGNDIDAWVEEESRRHHLLLNRMSRDLALYRQHLSGVPTDFNADYEQQFKSAMLSNLVNKLSAMMAGVDIQVDPPVKNRGMADAAQIVADFCYHCRAYEVDEYAIGGSDLQRDEFFYLLLYGRVVKRVLPDTSDPDYPFQTTVLDPATVFPFFGHTKGGMLRVIHKYRTKVGSILADFGHNDPKLETRLAEKMGYTGNVGDFLNAEGDVVDFWDTWNRQVRFNGVTIFQEAHKLGYVPFVYVTALGEPKGLATPQGRYALTENGDLVLANVNSDVDLMEKGVSVFHHLINTHLLDEAIHTILYGEIEKSRRPPTITYSAPQLVNNEPPALQYWAGANNQRVKGFQEVEGLPTSPHPTDIAPMLQHLQNDFYAGSLNPAAMTGNPGANASGYSLETLISQAKDLIIPYTKAFEHYLRLVFDLKLKLYRDVIAPVLTVSVPNQPDYGPPTQANPLTPEVLHQIGTRVTVRLRTINSDNLPRLAQTAGQLMASGLYSQKAAMDYVGVKNPAAMFKDILTEKGMQHPAVMTEFVIPHAMLEDGMPELADVFMKTAVEPMIAQQNGGLPTGGPGQPSGQAAGPNPNTGGQRTPGSPPNPPTGPLPGQGRTS